MKNRKLKIAAALTALVLGTSATAIACTNDAVSGSSPTRQQWQTSAAGEPTSSYFRFTIYENGTFQGRNILDTKPEAVCTTSLYAKIQLSDSKVSKVFLVKKKRQRAKILTLKARGLPPISAYQGNVPVLNLQTKTVCPNLDEPLKSNVYARYMKCGSEHRSAVTATRYPARLTAAID